MANQTPLRRPKSDTVKWVLGVFNSVENNGLVDAEKFAIDLRSNAHLRREIIELREDANKRLSDILAGPALSEFEDTHLTVSLLFELAIYEHFLGETEHGDQIDRERLFAHVDQQKRDMKSIATNMKLGRLSDIQIIKEFLDRLS